MTPEEQIMTILHQHPELYGEAVANVEKLLKEQKQEEQGNE